MKWSVFWEQFSSAVQTISSQSSAKPSASISLVGRRVVQQLQLKKHPHKLCITGAQGVSTGESSHSVTFVVKPVQTNQPTLSLTASVVH